MSNPIVRPLTPYDPPALCNAEGCERDATYATTITIAANVEPCPLAACDEHADLLKRVVTEMASGQGVWQMRRES